jgi:RNA polymerase sigma-70 factor (family 1)
MVIGTKNFFNIDPSMHPIYSNTELLARFHEGEEQAVQQLYKLHYRALCYYADTILQDKEGAEDIAADSFLKLLHRRTEFQTVPGIRQYLYTVTRNACIDILRRDKRRARDHGAISLLATGEEPGLEHELITAKLLELIYAEIEQLPTQCRNVFTSIFIDGKTTATIAAELGISPQTVLNQKTRALTLLRTKLYKEGYRDPGLLMLIIFILSAEMKVCL